MESRSVKRKAKNAGGLGRDRAAIFPAVTAPFPKSCASYFRFARFNMFPLYYLRAWHRLGTGYEANLASCQLKFPGKNCRQIYRKSIASVWRNLSTVFVSRILCCVAQVYKSFFFFFRKAVLRKLFDIRFSFIHCNFLRGCLLVKMASKTVTRSIFNQQI